MAKRERVNILVVDDDPKKRAALVAALAPLGHNLVTATSGREALHLVLRQDYAVMLLDVRMPDLDGFEMAALVRDRARSRHMPIIFITAHDQDELNTLAGYSLGAVDFIFPPVIPQVLQAKVQVFIDLAVARGKLEAANAELAERSAELEAVNRDLESFSYSVSHDLRAPLRAITGFAVALQEESAGTLDDEGKRLLRIVLDQGRMMGKLIDDLLEFSRLGRQALVTSNIDMSALVAQVLQELRQDAAPAIALPPLPDAAGDPALIKQVWVNLLANAIKFSANAPAPRIEVTGHADGVENVYCVRDNGAGFDMRQYYMLFGVFQRLHRSEEFPGTGVGLAIVERIVTRHGGRVWAEGEVGKGATFYFALPKSVTTAE